MATREIDAADLQKDDVLDDGTTVLDAYNAGGGRWIELSDGNTGMIRRGEARYRVRT